YNLPSNLGGSPRCSRSKNSLWNTWRGYYNTPWDEKSPPERSSISRWRKLAQGITGKTKIPKAAPESSVAFFHFPVEHPPGGSDDIGTGFYRKARVEMFYRKARVEIRTS